MSEPKENTAAHDDTIEGVHCRSMAVQTLKAFLAALERHATGGMISLDNARRAAAALIGGDPTMATAFARSEAHCEASFALANVERQRHDHLARLVTRPFAHLLDDPAVGLERRHLGQLFAAMRMMLGDEIHVELKGRAAIIADEHRGPDGLVDWDAFYGDDRSRELLETVLVTMAKSFRRFEPRKDWFLIMMNSTPSSVSVGSNAFVPLKPEDRVKGQFTEGHLARLFDAMFEPMRPNHFDAASRAAFAQRFGATPEALFGPFFVEIRAMSGRHGIS
ncbi:MAG: hypothetical protein H7Z12_11325 [Rhodospirillaceae bacterium]|nr:hypothetical protein [Rhodospirillales bacterium]